MLLHRNSCNNNNNNNNNNLSMAETDNLRKKVKFSTKQISTNGFNKFKFSSHSVFPLGIASSCQPRQYIM